jgi:type III restriction enzyme
MDLKNYQRRVIDEVESYLAAVAAERAKGNVRHAALDAWRDLKLGQYHEHTNGLCEDAPHFCIKVPTGGGKTLLATQILGSIYRTILKDRNGAGLVLWVVPSDQIYKDTLRRLRDRNDLYRLMLEHAVSRRIEVWEKQEISRLSPVRLRDCLNILVIKLASTNRETADQLKFFKDSGGNITQHFPPESDFDAQRALKEKFANLDMIENDPATGRFLCKTSIGNLVRLCKPPVILDEGHKATSPLARKTLEDFNASVVLELSATPKEIKTKEGSYRPNIISRVSGQELLDEEMIKLPLNIATSGQKAWKDVLTQALDKRVALAKKAIDYAEKTNAPKTVRPIVLVQVERTGKDQRGTDHIHSEEVKEYLIERLAIPEKAIAIKSSDTDDIEGIDLLAEGCPIEWIITKAALQEGWDCPYAYILVSLNNTGSGQSMTQLIGRILRQPNQQRLPEPFADLNESYIYCLHKRAGEISKEVKTALEKEGYEGESSSLIIDSSDKNTAKNDRTVHMRQEFADLYRKPFKGKIYLPHFCVKSGSSVEPLDYFRHLISQVNVDAFLYNTIQWNLTDDLKEARDRFYRLSLGQETLEPNRELDTDPFEPDYLVCSWIVASLPFDYLSHKQLRRIVLAVYAELVKTDLLVKDRLALVKFVVRDHIQRFIQQQLDMQTEAAFVRLFDAGRIHFYLECAYQIPDSFVIRATGPLKALTHNNGDQIAKSLFDFEPEEKKNDFENAVALVLDRNADVLWWYRNLVGDDQFSIQGYRKNRIRPDFVVQSAKNKKPIPRVIVIETKGKHLEGNTDTTYKRDVAAYFEKVGKKVTWQQLAADFADNVFRFQILDETQDDGRDWKDQLRELLALDA